MKKAWHILIKNMLLAIDKEFEDYECLPEDLFDVYVEARTAIGYPIVVASLSEFDGLDSRYQLLQDAIDGKAWPPTDWVDSGAMPK